MKNEWIKGFLSDLGSEVISKLIWRAIAIIAISIFIGVGIYAVKKRTEKQLKKAIIEVKTLNADEVSKRAGKVAGDAAKDFMEARDSFKKAYLKAKGDTLK